MNKKKYNIIFILLDGARVDRLNKSQAFGNILKEGLFFDNMIAAAPYTVASMHSMLSGMYGSKNGVDAYNHMFKFKDDCKTLAEYFQESGYFTRGGTFRLSLVPERGFDKLSEYDENSDDVLEVHKRIIDETCEHEKPFFLYLHYADIHSNIVKNVFDIYDDFDDEYFNNIEKNSEFYNTLINKAGDYTENIYKYLDQKKLLEDSIVIVTSDHGMGVGEKKGERAYGIFTYDYSIKSFCIFFQPRLFKKNSTVSNLVRTIDIMPTLLDLLNINPDSNFKSLQGESLMPLINLSFFDIIKNFLRLKTNKDRIAYCETGGLFGPWPSPTSPNVKCVRTKDWKLIHNLTPENWELYNLREDPTESRNIVGNNPLVESMLRKELKKIERDCRVN